MSWDLGGQSVVDWQLWVCAALVALSKIEHTWYQVERPFQPKYLSQKRYLVANGALLGYLAICGSFLGGLA